MTAVGRVYRYVAAHSRDAGFPRYGQLVTVLAWHRSKALVRFPDGWQAIVPGRCLRRAGPHSV